MNIISNYLILLSTFPNAYSESKAYERTFVNQKFVGFVLGPSSETFPGNYLVYTVLLLEAALFIILFISGIARGNG